VLEGRIEHPFLITAGAAALLVVALLVGFLAPALPEEGNGVYTSAVALTQAGLDGRDVYLSEGCSSCHTQVVRPIVADVGLGPVTIADSNQILGVRRYGPDLAHIGSRVESRSSLLTVLTNSSEHPSYAGLSNEDLENLTAYLFESK
jgi:cbb3-type cytochrome oxidase cytochrome c subunit